MRVIFLFVSVILLFARDGDRYGTAATSVAELLETIINGLQSLLFVIGAFVWDVLAVPDPPLPLCFQHKQYYGLFGSILQLGLLL